MIKILFSLLVVFGVQVSFADQSPAEIKAEILKLAKSYEGQGDPDFSRQKSLEVLVQKLLKASPQPPVAQRLPLLYGVWKQVWGPYDYRNNKRGVDPTLEVKEIYQAVFPGGYYYNVSPIYKNGDRTKSRIGLLRGEYRQDSRNLNALNVKFTRYPGVKNRPADGSPIWDLAVLAEEGRLEGKITIVPTFVVKLFFSGGALNEIYTDEDTRILYGANNTEFKNPYLYVMTRVD